LRFVDPAQVHLTVRFIGEVTDEVTTAIAGVLDTIVPVPPFTLALAAPGWLPGPARPRVLKYDIASGQDELRRVHAFVEAALGRVGIPGETRPFVPHVTLARVRDEWARRVRADAASGRTAPARPRAARERA
jgi:RNA 2',3'-cyclic 3'-phosphodiesterase